MPYQRIRFRCGIVTETNSSRNCYQEAWYFCGFSFSIKKEKNKKTSHTEKLYTCNIIGRV